jgi:hypothetical protein
MTAVSADFPGARIGQRMGKGAVRAIVKEIQAGHFNQGYIFVHQHCPPALPPALPSPLG